MRLKNSFFALTVLLVQAGFIHAQIDSSYFRAALMPDNNKVETGRIAVEIDSGRIKYNQCEMDPISEIPTMGEINNLFFLAEQGKRDPFIVANEIALKMDNALPALRAFLLKGTEERADTSKKKKKYAKGEYAVYVLDAIGSPKAKQLLSEIALNQPDKEVKGLAIKMLSWNYFNKAENDSVEPDKELLHVLLKSADDTTYVKGCEKQIGNIAREGIKNWTGEDHGNTKDKGKTKNNNGTHSTIFTSYSEQWWQNNSHKVKWDHAVKHFTVK